MSPNASPNASPAPPDALVLPPSFPVGDYTPHGYIDNPYHTMVLNRSGVIRSVPPLGFGWWRRRFKGCYGGGTREHVNYLSLLQMSVVCDGLQLVTAEDFAAAGIELASKYHTKHIVSYDWQLEDLTFSLKYFLSREHTLACLMEIDNGASAAREVFLHATHIYGLWETPWWGSDGLAMRYVPIADAAVSAIWAYGDYFALGADVHSVACKATGGRAQREAWIRANDLTSTPVTTVRGPGPLHAILSYKLTVPAGKRARALFCLSRAPNELAVLRELAAGLGDALPMLERQLDRDEVFWSGCPHIEGDWPETWKHGWVYDWETLRMNVRPPAGIFKHPWDAMQVHSPRCVLAETSVDMFALSHADPELAKEVLLGTFADAVAPNVPCCREDGSVNMIAADGEACGTAPSWCFPFHVIRAIYAATGDAAWLTQLYPHLKAYLDWWLAHRTDEHGGLHCHCDWESGQDGSRRFPAAEGALADAVRALDVEAAMVEALRNMVLFAEITDQLEDKPRWRELAEQHTQAVRAMFVDGGFRDFDARTNRPIITPDYFDVMMLAPLTCGVATPEQIAAVRPRFQHFRDHAQPWLEWPSFFLAYTEAAWAAGLNGLAAEATGEIVERVYARTDARAVRFANRDEPFNYRIPGVACEFWPLSDEIEPGGECYGWGATLSLHIIRNIFGFRETENLDGVEFFVAPSLPQRLMAPGKTYALHNLSFRGVELSIRCEVAAGEKLRIRLTYVGPRPVRAAVHTRDDDASVASAAGGERGTLAWDSVNGQVFVVRLAE